ncbi:hypothetical protein [Xanthomonas sacchari]
MAPAIGAGYEAWIAASTQAWTKKEEPANRLLVFLPDRQQAIRLTQP